ncbi:MAG TPA: ABC transporter substrate-binding protein [Bacteroidales bacterium]|nr:ABC transporter substrate-binding protein [Bacteroidales bacterium]
MKTSYGSFLPIVLLCVLTFTPVNAQDKKSNYGNIPDELVAYDKYQKAYKYHFLEPINFYGAGREKPEPAGLKEVRIGFLGPMEGSILVNLGKQMLQGAQLAIDEANAKGGYKGLPFRLMIHNDVGLWGAAANEVVRMDDEKVWAWVGSIDDNVSHIAIRATLKLEIPNVNTGNPDPTFTETNIPWVIRVIPDDRQSCYALIDQIFNKDKHSRVAVIRANNRYGRAGTLHFTRSATRVGFPVIIEERFSDGETDFKTQLERIKKTNADAILIWGNAKESALILTQLRNLDMNQPVYTSDRVVSDDFISLAGKLADGIVTTCQYNPDNDNPGLKKFQANYRRKYGMEPDVIAAHTYDGMNILIDAIRKVGLNRVLIRDVLTDLKTFQNFNGVTGPIIFDKTWNNIRPIYMARITNGKFSFSPAPLFSKDDKIYKKPKSEY